ncbi:MAG: phosphate signaling complex protein PhoU [Planctomycetota bacterium]|jgi:phosphate transport system protein|nr:phosphate signaling complex protein PhoU [Planctomycetaceae bacterium]
MSLHLKQDLDVARVSLLKLSGMVEDMIALAVKSLMLRQGILASDVVRRDSEVDSAEVRIEEDCLKMLALHQPVAADLRRVTTMMKVNNDLERMADLACNIAQRADSLCTHPEFPIPNGINEMATMVTRMVRASLDAFVSNDSAMARSVIIMDDPLDAKNVQVIGVLAESIQKDPFQVEAALHAFSASRHLEQIGDLAVSIAEDVIYMVEGVIIRHRQAS